MAKIEITININKIDETEEIKMRMNKFLHKIFSKYYKFEDKDLLGYSVYFNSIERSRKALRSVNKILELKEKIEKEFNINLNVYLYGDALAIY